MTKFVHTHLHTHYSILESTIKIKELAKRAKELGLEAIAITDHGNMFGVKKFHTTMLQNGIKPILGCDINVVENLNVRNNKEKAGYSITLLAKNVDGYQNLMELVSVAWTQGFFFRPRIDRNLLSRLSSGLICILNAEVNVDAIKEYREIFEGDLYLEMQPHSLQKVDALAKECKVKYVATNDVRFLREDGARTLDVLLAISTGRSLNDPKRLRYSAQSYLKSAEQMIELFAEYPEAIENSIEIANKVEIYSIDKPMLMPVVELPNHFSSSYEYLRHLVFEGAHRRYGFELPQQITDRVELELNAIHKIGASDYLLIIWDLVKYSRKNGAIVSGGRGTSSGSIVAYCLEITNIDPIKYNLLFERFTPVNSLLPNIDIDIDEEDYSNAIDYLVKKYGKDCVGQVIEFETFSAKTSIKDVGRVLDMPYSKVNRITELIPAHTGITFSSAYYESPALCHERNFGSMKVVEVLENAEKLEGIIRQTGIHDCGVVLCREELYRVAPLSTSGYAKFPVVQYESKYFDQIGLLQIDILGLMVKRRPENADKFF